jgi:hypothetical protein
MTFQSNLVKPLEERLLGDPGKNATAFRALGGALEQCNKYTQSNCIYCLLLLPVSNWLDSLIGWVANS